MKASSLLSPFSVLTMVAGLAAVLLSGSAQAEPLNVSTLGISRVDEQRYDVDKPIVIAVVDDAFDDKARYLNGMLWSNPNEIDGNGIDDDNNGRVDDVHGWDVSDLDENLAPPKSRQSEFNHGIYIAGLIAEVIRAKLGERDDYPIKLMLVKSVSDQMSQLTMKDGYLGIDYAVQQQADIIANAWSGGSKSRSAKQSLNAARNSSTFIVNAVGNYPSTESSFPASHPAVFGVAGVDQKGERSEKSNFGIEVDLAAYSDNVDGTQWGSDRRQVQSGTSVSAALVAATAALMKLANQFHGPSQLSLCLKASAAPIDKFNPLIPAKLGAGSLQIDDAIDCAKNPLAFLEKQQGLIKHAEGSIGVSRSGEFDWTIAPDGPVEQISISVPAHMRKDRKAELVVSGDATIYQGALDEMPESLTVPGSVARISIRSKGKPREFEWMANFESTPIDLEERFCRGRVNVNLDDLSPRVVEDGSAGQPYAANSNCQWFIAHENGKSIRLDFSRVKLAEGDTVYLFNSDNSEQANLLATLKGNNLPPSILVNRAPLLIWFLTDSEHHGGGFSLQLSRQAL